MYFSGIPSRQQVLYESVFNQLAILFVNFLNSNFDVFSTRFENSSHVLNFLVKLTLYKSDEVFKTCLEFWKKFSNFLVENESFLADFFLKFSEVLSNLRSVLIRIFPRPPEVIVKELEDGTV